MIRISLTDNFSTLDRLLMVLEHDQMPFAIARALTDMAQLGKATITREIPAIFSKGGPPKPFTVNSVVARCSATIKARHARQSGAITALHIDLRPIVASITDRVL